MSRMNSHFINRLLEAKKYQKMAFQALLPKNVVQHLDVIEGEIKAMVVECMMDGIQENLRNKNSSFAALKEGYKRGSSEETVGEKNSEEKNSKVKKVMIG